MIEHEELPEEQYEEPIHGVFTDLFEAQLVPPTWVIEDLLPVGLVFVGAPPKSGKSTLTMAMSALVAGFECKALPKFLSHAPATGRVQIYSYEATAGELRHMMEFGLRVTGRNDESIIVADDPWMFRLDDDDGLAKMLGWLDDKKPKLCILDPLRDFHQLEEKDSGGMNRMLRPLRQWAVKNDACVLIVHHTRKVDDEKQVYTAADMRGTSALFGIADGVLMLTPQPSGTVKMQATFKRAKGWDRTLRISAYDFTGLASEVLTQEDNLVWNAVRSGFEDEEEIIAQVHVGRDRLRNTLAKLDRNGHIQKVGMWWRPTQQLPQPRRQDDQAGRAGALVHVPPPEGRGDRQVRRAEGQGARAGFDDGEALPRERGPDLRDQATPGSGDVGERFYRVSRQVKK